MVQKSDDHHLGCLKTLVNDGLTHILAGAGFPNHQQYVDKLKVEKEKKHCTKSALRRVVDID